MALVVFLANLATSAAECGPDIRLVAHRGGVVDETHPENTLASLEEAIRRGYWMIEVDVQRSQDGRLVVQHDDDFRRIYGVKRKTADMTWDEIRALRSKIGDRPPCDFAEFAAHCKGKTRLMLDSRETGVQGGFFEEMERILREDDLLDTAFFIGSDEMKAHFKDKARIATNRRRLKEAVEAGEPVAARYFLFGHGNDLDEDDVRYAQSVGVPVVASVNDFHYLLKRGAATPESDIRQLLRWGVTHFQIDSMYERFFDRGETECKP